MDVLNNCCKVLKFIGQPAYCTTLSCDTVNGERFAGLNFCGFHPMKFFMRKLSRFLTFTTLKQHHYTKLV